MHIDENNPLPLYYQLRENIRDKIINGEWKYGQEIPSETTLCKELNLSRSTIKQAFDGLISEGLIVRKRGKGTYVSYKKLSYKMIEQPNFYCQMEEEGAAQESLIIEKKYVGITDKTARFLEVPVGTEAAYFKRIRNIDNIPMIIQDVYILPDYEKGLLQQDLTDISFHRYIEEANNFILDYFSIDISTIILNEEEQQCFGLDKQMSGFHFDTVYQSRGKKIIYNERIFRGDMINLSLNFDYSDPERSRKEFNIINDRIK